MTRRVVPRSRRSAGRSAERAGQLGPFTRAGIAVVLLGAVAYVGGWRLGWIELMVLAAACLLAVVLAVPFVVGRSRIQLTREISPVRVMVGEPAVAELVATNPTRAPIRRVRVEELLADRTIPVDVPALRPGGEHRALYSLPTDRRGVLTVGPAVVTRADPAGLLRRAVAQTTVQQVWVHPRWGLVRPLPLGFAKDLEGPTSEASPAGDVAFHAIRPYVIGDDPRHVHWMSTARTGQPMVRHYVDNRRPNMAVVLDGDAAAYHGDEFETGVEVTASLILSSLAARLPVTARVGREWLLGRANPGDHDAVLERCTTCTTTHDADVLVARVADTLRVEPATSAIVIVTARRPTDALLAAIVHARRRARPIIVNVAADVDAIPPALPGARVLRVRSLAEFRNAWDRTLA
jgi:uncharacterized protein (DUF58 family)